MHTLVDFLTRVKGIEYLISVVAITGFILYVEILKPKPFKALARNVREDIDHLRASGGRNALRTVGRFASAPFIGLFYVISLPFLFVGTFAKELAGMAADALGRATGEARRTVSFGWRPTEAYLGGRKDKKDKGDKSAEDAGEKEGKA
ncbi:MAG: hypothetical protein ACM3NF_03525 [Gemmatimonadota bacterium]